MKYPKFLKKGDKIGICAPSAGEGRNLEDFNKSIEILKNQGYEIVETKHVRVDNQRSASAKVRAKELEELFLDDSVDMVMCATGGDFMYEIMPYVNFKKLVEHPKWIMGYSDPTNVLFPLTCKYDIATLYGFNGGSYCDSDPSQDDNLEILKGNIVKQKSFKNYQTFIDSIEGKTSFDKKVFWESENNVEFSGRLIGGCLEILANDIGTEYEDVKGFIERYKEDGIIWYFDIFSMSAYNVYLTLLHFKNAGWFKNCKGIIIGRVAFPNNEDNKTVTYSWAYKHALKGIPYIAEADIGHTKPHMTLINGCYSKIKVNSGKGSIEQILR